MTHPTPDSQITRLDAETENVIKRFGETFALWRDESYVLDREKRAEVIDTLRARIRTLMEEARKEGYWKVVPGHGDVPDGIVPR